MRFWRIVAYRFYCVSWVLEISGLEKTVRGSFHLET